MYTGGKIKYLIYVLIALPSSSVFVGLCRRIRKSPQGKEKEIGRLKGQNNLYLSTIPYKNEDGYGFYNVFKDISQHTYWTSIDEHWKYKDE